MAVRACCINLAKVEITLGGCPRLLHRGRQLPVVETGDSRSIFRKPDRRKSLSSSNHTASVIRFWAKTEAMLCRTVSLPAGKRKTRLTTHRLFLRLWTSSFESERYFRSSRLQLKTASLWFLFVQMYDNYTLIPSNLHRSAVENQRRGFQVSHKGSGE